MRTVGPYIVFFDKEDFCSRYDAFGLRLNGGSYYKGIPAQYPCYFKYIPPFHAQFSGDYEEASAEEVIEYIKEQIFYWNNLKYLLTNN